MVPVGSSSTQLEDRGTSAGGGAAEVVDLSPDEIRQVQIMLNQKGFSVGAPDGRWGPRTTQALIMFQQRQGLQATGRIDSRTVTALGVSVRSQSSTTGQGGSTMQQPPANQPSANQPPANQQQGQGANPPATTGQGNAQQPSANQPSANQPPANQQQGGQGRNQPPTTGQGGAGQNNPGSSGSPNMNPSAQQPNQPSQSGDGSRNAPAQGGQSR
jgi:hypothetical protein